MRYLFPIITLISFLLSGCSGGNKALLKQADAIMEENPDSAMTILRQIDRGHLSKGDLPYYALLMTQAQVKNDIPLDSDSLISIAYAKYADAWRGDKGIRSAFYMGEIFFNQDRSREAMHHYLSAYEDSKRLDDDYWHAKSAERIADLFFNAYNYPEAEKYMTEAAQIFGKCGKIRNQKYALAALGITYINSQKIESARSLLDSLYREVSSSQPVDSALLSYIRRPMIDIVARTGDSYGFSASDFVTLKQTASAIEDIDNTILLSIISKSYGKDMTFDVQNGFERISSMASTNEDKALLYYARYLYEKESGNLMNALNFVDSLLYFQSALSEDIMKESISMVARDYYSGKAYYDNKRARYLSIILLLLFIVALLTMTMGWKYTRNKIQKHRYELEQCLIQ